MLQPGNEAAKPDWSGRNSSLAHFAERRTPIDINDEQADECVNNSFINRITDALGPILDDQTTVTANQDGHNSEQKRF